MGAPDCNLIKLVREAPYANRSYCRRWLELCCKKITVIDLIAVPTASTWILSVYQQIKHKQRNKLR